MGLPIRLAHRPSVWRGNPLEIKVKCASKKTGQAVDLTRFGAPWTGNIRLSHDAPVIDTFDIDETLAASGELDLLLDGTRTPLLTGPYYVFELVADRSPTPLTVFIGDFQVEGGSLDNPLLGAHPLVTARRRHTSA